MSCGQKEWDIEESTKAAEALKKKLASISPEDMWHLQAELKESVRCLELAKTNEIPLTSFQRNCLDGALDNLERALKRLT